MIMKDSSCSYFHPKEGVGVCPLFLNERLLILASTTATATATHRFVQPVSRIKSPNFFACTCLLNRLQFKPSKSQTSDAASTPQADSFISIEFEEDGVGSWETGEVTKVSLEHCTPTMTQNQREANKSVVEQVKPHGLLRWRKRWATCSNSSKVEEVQQATRVPYWQQGDEEGLDKDSSKENQRIKSSCFVV